ncbi:MAG: AAA family ATPase [Candidatus Limnocylindrales bacterium]
MGAEQVLGRTDELAAIDAFVAEFPAGARALVLSGEAGFGKTVLWTAAERLARERGGITVLSARASAAESDLAYVVLTDLLGPIASHALPTLPGPQADALAAALLLATPGREPAMTDPRTIGTAVLGTLRGAALERPVILAIDDAQWIDHASVAALDFALRRATTEPIGLLLTVRTGIGASTRSTITTVMGPRTTNIDVGPISLGVLHHLVRDRTEASLTRPQLVRLEAASRGNPLLAIEIGRELARLERWPAVGEPLPIPTDVASLFGEQIGRLDDAERDLLFVAAAMSTSTLATVTASGEHRDGIERLVAAGLLIVAADGRVRFSHPLMAEAALRAVTPVKARALHARLALRATTVEDRGRHIALTSDGPDAESAASVEAAATSARGRGATWVAAGWAEAAAQLTPPDDAERRGARLTTAGRWFAESGEVERGGELLRQAEAALPAGDARAAARLALAQVEGWDHGPAAVVRRCEAALADARDPDLRARIRLRLAGEVDVLGSAAALEQAEAAVRELESISDDADGVDPDLLACALLQAASLRFESGRGDDAGAVARAVALLGPEPRRGRDGDWRPESLRAHAIRWQWAVDHDDLAAAMIGAMADLQRTRDFGLDRPQPLQEAEVAILAAWMGDLTSADRHARAAIESADLVATREARSAALGATGLVACLRGDLDGATVAARAGLALQADPPDWLDARHVANLGAAALVSGDPMTATTALGTLFDRLVAKGSRESLPFRFAADLVEAAVAAGEIARAHVVVEVLEESARIVPRPWISVMAARGRALVSAAEGDLDGADAAARAALEAAERLPMPIERARTALIAGRIARRRKERRRAATLLGTAVDGFRAMGADAWLAIAEADVARLGRRPAGGRTDDLTETEDRVAQLAAAGLTNREVGEAAFLTAKSVEGVLARVYGKLGIRSRAELGAWLAARESSTGGPPG